MQTAIRVIAIIALIALPAALVAAEDRGGERREDPAREHIEMMLQSRSDSQLGRLEVGELLDLAGAISVYQQQRRYVASSALKSAMIPGSGQFKNDETGRGILFLAAEILVSAGTLVGSYFLLPESVQFSSLNYFTDDFADIESAWKGLSFADLLPSIGVSAAGSIASGAIRMFAARDAADIARRRIAGGVVTFDPRPFSILGGPEMMHHGW